MRVNDLPIERKLVLLTLLTSGAALILAVAGFSGYEWLNARAQAHGKLSTLASVLASNSAAALAFEDSVAAEENLQALAAESRVTGACIYDADGKLFASYRGRPESVCGLDTSAIGSRASSGDVIRIVKPILLGEDILGRLVIEGDLYELRRRLVEYGGIAFLVLLVSGSVSLLLAHGLQRLISDPIRDLAAAAQAVARDKVFALRAVKRGDDECGRLVDAFNEMLAQLEKRDAELEAHRRSLEAEVVERTAELQEANSELQTEVAVRKKAEAALRRQALHDGLTGIPNRDMLMAELDLACSKLAQDPKDAFALLFVDLDGFKLINDSLGHGAGDSLLRRAAGRLLETVRSGDLVARIGGDEFAILLSNVCDPNEARSLAERCRKALSRPFQVQGSEVFITASIGVAFGDEKSPEALLRDADAAMYRSKSGGKAAVSLFSDEMRAFPEGELKLRASLRSALHADELFVEYQPVESLVEHKPVACEALVRWRTKDGKVLYPGSFIQAAEESGLIGDLGRWVLRRSCREFVESGLHKTSMQLSVNVSPLQFRNADFTKEVTEILAESGLSPDRLRVEITESCLLNDVKGAETRLGQLNDAGVKVAIDDFGTGYSSLAYLRHLPIHVLKIDRTFVRNIASNRADYEIVSSIAGLGRALGLIVTAEGVETEQQEYSLRVVGCHEAQGYYFGRPSTIDEVAAAASTEATRQG